MSTQLAASPKRKSGKRIIKRVIKLIIVLLVLAAAFVTLVKFNIIKLNGSNNTNSQQVRTVKVEKGSLTVTVTGSGPIESSGRYEITPSVDGTVSNVYVKEGDRVKAGQLMFALDDTDAKTNLEKIENDIEENELNKSKNVTNIKNLNVTAPFDGYVTDITAKEGDSLNNNTSVLTLTDKSKFKLTVNFRGLDIGDIKKGQQVKLFLYDRMIYINGTVSFVSDKGQAADDGGTLYSVEILIDNPGYTLEGMTASVETDKNGRTINADDSGTISFADSVAVKSEVGGTVESIKVKDGQYVKKGQTLLEISNDDLDTTTDTLDFNRKSLQSDLENAQKQLSYYRIYAPGDGVVVSQDIKVGDNVKSGNVISTVADSEHMEFEISIDELDIAKIKVGQKVNLSVDALTETTEKPLTGEVIQIAMEGTSNNGVTTYPVTIKINETSNLKVGMNANASIIVNEKSDVLLVPLEAIQKMGNKNFVKVKSNNQDSQGAANQNTGMRSFNGNNTANENNSSGENNVSKANNTSNAAANQGNSSGQTKSNRNSSNMKNKINGLLKPVEIGINNDEYVEIVSGLQGGEEIILPTLAASTTTTQNTMQMGGFGGSMEGPPSEGNYRIRSSNGSSSSSKSSSSSGGK